MTNSQTYIQTVPAAQLGAFAVKYALGNIVAIADQSGSQQYRVTAFQSTEASADALGPRVSMMITLEPVS